LSLSRYFQDIENVDGVLYMCNINSIDKIQAEMTHGLRQRVLRPNGEIDDCVFSGDQDLETIHFGAYKDTLLIGVASIYREQQSKTKNPLGWRIRGMATDPSVRGQGYGQLLVQACIELAKERKAEELWCNARLSAIGFYQKLGFEILGDEFELPTIGPHYRITLYF
jgi:ribosomal protein S18 acetylase RimI-like enzyme